MPKIKKYAIIIIRFIIVTTNKVISLKFMAAGLVIGSEAMGP